jgi:hypothetical protein
MPLIIPANSGGGSSTNQGGGGGSGLGPLSRIYAEYENSQKAKKKQAVVKKRSADRMDGGGGGTVGVDDDGGGKNRKKKIRLEWGSSSNPPQRSSAALKERPLIDTNVNVPTATAAVDGKSIICTKMAQKGGRVLNQMHVKPTPLCNFDGGCTDNSIKDGLCKTHWCAVNLCAHDGCIKLAWSKGFCREHNNNFRKNSNHVRMSKHDRVKEDNSESSTKDEARDTGKFLHVKEEAKTMEVKELDKKKQKQNVSGVNKESSHRKSCTAEGCQNQSVVNGVCFRHGAKRKLCGTDTCTSFLSWEEFASATERSASSASFANQKAARI